MFNKKTCSINNKKLTLSFYIFVVRSGCWFTWDIVSTPPSQYKTWESQWIMPTVKESDNLINILETSHNAKRIDNILKGLPVPPPLENFISIDRLADDIVSLLCGLPSSTFQLVLIYFIIFFISTDITDNNEMKRTVSTLNSSSL